MSVDTSATGITAIVVASGTYPSGFPVSEWSGESDPLDVPEITIREYQSGCNGDLESWKKVNPIQVKLSVIANTPSDTYLTFLFNSNKPAKNRKTSNDKITITFTYPDGEVKTCINGFIDTGTPIKSVASSGKLKARTFGFTFEDII